MGVGLQDKLNKFQFERTVDWRIKFVKLFDEMIQMGGVAMGIGERLKNDVLYDGYLFAQSCEFTPGMVTYKQDQQVGYYNSSLSFPSLQFTLFLGINYLAPQRNSAGIRADSTRNSGNFGEYAELCI